MNEICSYTRENNKDNERIAIMSDLISRQKIIDKMRQHRALFCKNKVEFMTLPKDEKARVDEIDNCIADLVNSSSIEIEYKKGKWIRREDEDCWECSVCHAVLENSDIENHNFYYCYHCGANMMDKCGCMDLEKINDEESELKFPPPRIV